MFYEFGTLSTVVQVCQRCCQEGVFVMFVRHVVVEVLLIAKKCLLMLSGLISQGRTVNSFNNDL